MSDLAYGTEIRKRHADNFIVGFDRLVKLANECDSDNIILDSLIYSVHCLFSNRLRELHPQIQFELITGADSVVYLEQIVILQA
jgi:hypothetical protein